MKFERDVQPSIAGSRRCVWPARPASCLRPARSGSSCPVLVGAGEEEDVLAVKPLKARQRIGRDRLIGVADMRMRIGDRGRDVVGLAARWRGCGRGRRSGPPRGCLRLSASPPFWSACLFRRGGEFLRRRLLRRFLARFLVDLGSFGGFSQSAWRSSCTLFLADFFVFFATRLVFVMLLAAFPVARAGGDI